LRDLAAYLRRNHLGVLALFVALGGTGYAASKVGSDDIERNAVKSRHIGPNEVKSRDLRCPIGFGRVLGVCYERELRPATGSGQARGECTQARLRLPTASEALLMVRRVLEPPTGGTASTWPGIWVSDLEVEAKFDVNLTPDGRAFVRYGGPDELQYVCVKPAGG
jgi:hypothetical protein